MSSPKKAGKKNKQKKPKSIIPEDGSSNDLVIVDEPVPTPKNKPSPSTKAVVTSNNATPNASANKKRKKRDSGSSDEERWLTAIESGKLEDVDDELKKIKPKDPALMTARQRAMYDRGSEGPNSVSTPALMSLPTGYKVCSIWNEIHRIFMVNFQEKVLTAEAIQKAAIKSLKRKQLADEKREKDKKKTMERLLKKQDSKAAKQAKPKVVKSCIPAIIYKQNIEKTVMLFPEGCDYPLQCKKISQIPEKKYCSMGCGNLRKYSCSKTGNPLCSLECYKMLISNLIT